MPGIPHPLAAPARIAVCDDDYRRRLIATAAPGGFLTRWLTSADGWQAGTWLADLVLRDPASPRPSTATALVVLRSPQRHVLAIHGAVVRMRGAWNPVGLEMAPAVIRPLLPTFEPERPARPEANTSDDFWRCIRTLHAALTDPVAWFMAPVAARSIEDLSSEQVTLLVGRASLGLSSEVESKVHDAWTGLNVKGTDALALNARGWTPELARSVLSRHPHATYILFDNAYEAKRRMDWLDRWEQVCGTPRRAGLYAAAGYRLPEARRAETLKRTPSPTDESLELLGALRGGDRL